MHCLLSLFSIATKMRRGRSNIAEVNAGVNGVAHSLSRLRRRGATKKIRCNTFCLYYYALTIWQQNSWSHIPGSLSQCQHKPLLRGVCFRRRDSPQNTVSVHSARRVLFRVRKTVLLRVIRRFPLLRHYVCPTASY
jgi:hypothetical protein